MNREMTFETLTEQVKTVHEATSAYAKGAVNQLLSIRNWAIGCYIVEYEQNGQERAKYGSNLLKMLAKTLSIKGLEHNQLNLCRIFYRRYPQIFSTASRKLQAIEGEHPAPVFKLIEKHLDDDAPDSKKISTVSSKFETPARGGIQLNAPNPFQDFQGAPGISHNPELEARSDEALYNSLDGSSNENGKNDELKLFL